MTGDAPDYRSDHEVGVVHSLARPTARRQTRVAQSACLTPTEGSTQEVVSGRAGVVPTARSWGLSLAAMDGGPPALGGWAVRAGGPPGAPLGRSLSEARALNSHLTSAVWETSHGQRIRERRRRLGVRRSAPGSLLLMRCSFVRLSRVGRGSTRRPRSGSGGAGRCRGVIPKLVAAAFDLEPLARGRLGGEGVAVHRPAAGEPQLDQVDAHHPPGACVGRPPGPRSWTPRRPRPPLPSASLHWARRRQPPDDTTDRKQLFNTVGWASVIFRGTTPGPHGQGDSRPARRGRPWRNAGSRMVARPERFPRGIDLRLV